VACDPPQAEASKDEVAHLERVLSQEIQVPDVSCVLSHVCSLFAELASQESRLIASLLDEERQVAHVTCDV
jgi:hypothetical protein